jgi:hypothetical protein
MKKIYQIPTVTVVKIQTVHMIAESIGIGANYNGSEEIQSRSADFWEDDEE